MSRKHLPALNLECRGYLTRLAFLMHVPLLAPPDHARGAARRRRPYGCTAQALNERAMGSPLFAARLTQVVEDRLLAALVKHPCVSLDGEIAGVRLRVQ